MLTTSIHEALTLVKKHYQFFGGGDITKDNPGIKHEHVNHSLFAGCLQWHYTDINLFDINKLDIENSTFGVIVNFDVVVQLLINGVKKENIVFYSDCEFKSKWMEKLDVKYVSINSSRKGILKAMENIKKTGPKVDYVLNNVPFGMFKEFKDLAKSLAKEKALIISGSRDYHNNEDAFSNVELYKYLGKCFPTAKIVASLVVVNPNHTSNDILIEDSTGKLVSVQRNHAVAPSTDPYEWIWTQSVLDLKLPGYDQFTTGGLYRKDAMFDPQGIDIAFTMGKVNAEFDDENYGKSYKEIQSPTTAWSKVNKSQIPLLGGYGQHAIGISYMASIGHLGHVKYLSPSMGCGQKTYWHPVTDKNDAIEAIRYLNHPDVVRLVKVLKSCVASNSRETFKLIPHHSRAKDWIKGYV